MKLFYFLIFLILLSCKGKDKKVVEDKSFSPVILKKTQIEGTPIPIDALFVPARLQIGENLLYVSCFKGDTLIYTYSLPDFKLLNRFGRRGHGPDDFMFPMFTNARKDTVGIWGYPDLKKIKEFKVDPAGSWHFIREYRLPENKAYNQIFKANDSTAYYNDYPPALILRKINLNQSRNEKEYAFEMDKPRGEAFFMKNKGDLAGAGSHLAYLYYYSDRIDFFNPDFQVVATYTGPGGESSIESGNMQDNVVHYIGSFAGEHYLYAIHHGAKLKYKSGQFSTLEIFDWKGQLKSTVELSPAADLFVVDEKNQLLYGYNNTRPDCFYRYSLEAASVLK